MTQFCIRSQQATVFQVLQTYLHKKNYVLHVLLSSFHILNKIFLHVINIIPDTYLEITYTY